MAKSKTIVEALRSATENRAFAEYENREIGFLPLKTVKVWPNQKKGFEILKTESGFEQIGIKGQNYYFWRKTSSSNIIHGCKNLLEYYNMHIKQKL